MRQTGNLKSIYCCFKTILLFIKHTIMKKIFYLLCCLSIMTAAGCRTVHIPERSEQEIVRALIFAEDDTLFLIGDRHDFVFSPQFWRLDGKTGRSDDLGRLRVLLQSPYRARLTGGEIVINVLDNQEARIYYRPYFDSLSKAEKEQISRDTGVDPDKSILHAGKGVVGRLPDREMLLSRYPLHRPAIATVRYAQSRRVFSAEPAGLLLLPLTIPVGMVVWGAACLHGAISGPPGGGC